MKSLKRPKRSTSGHFLGLKKYDQSPWEVDQSGTIMTQAPPIKALKAI